MFNQYVFSKKKIREEKRKGDVVHIFKNNKTFDKYELQISTKITLYSGIKTTMTIYQTEARIKIQNMKRSPFGKSILYPISIVYKILWRLKVLTHHFHFTYFRFNSIEL